MSHNDTISGNSEGKLLFPFLYHCKECTQPLHAGEEMMVLGLKGHVKP